MYLMLVQVKNKKKKTTPPLGYLAVQSTVWRKFRKPDIFPITIIICSFGQKVGLTQSSNTVPWWYVPNKLTTQLQWLKLYIYINSLDLGLSFYDKNSNFIILKTFKFRRQLLLLVHQKYKTFINTWISTMLITYSTNEKY